MDRYKRTRILFTFLMTFGLLGGIFSFFDTSGMHYNYTPLTMHSYAWHILLILIGIISGKRADYALKGYLGAAFIYLLCCGIATILNLTLYQYGHLDMFYISPRYYMSQKFFRVIAQELGNPAGILIYILSTLFGGFLLHCGWKMWISQLGTGQNYESETSQRIR